MTPNTFTIALGTASCPQLRDHGFQGLTVLPGAYYLEWALRQSPGGIVRKVRFQRPFILEGKEALLTSEAAMVESGLVRFSFREGGGETDGAEPCASLEIDTGAAALASRAPDGMERGSGIPAAEIYARLQANGNHYGPAFQALERAWLEPGGCLVSLRPDFLTQKGEQPPVMFAVDAAVQALAAACSDAGRTFILRGIDEMLWSGADLARARWALVRLQAEADKVRGEIQVWAEDGVGCLELRGVTADLRPRATEEKIVVAATFTAEPLEPVIAFWSGYLHRPLVVEFAPYNQVFQELLDPGSAFHRNAGGFNVALVNLADWMRPAAAPAKRAGEADPKDGLERLALPNGLRVAQINRHETEYVYREIFEDRCYLRHGIRLPAGATVIDIGANIGLFTLFVRTECPDASVLAFEPSPVVFRALEANCAAYGPGLRAFNAGVGEHRTVAPLTFYESSSVFSSFHPDAEEDGRAIRTVVENVVRGAIGGGVRDEQADVEELMRGRLASRTFDCPLVPVSDIVREQRLARIDLLKIDAEKCELEILRGIEEDHWPLIGQIVIEVHDRTGAILAETVRLLAARGFQCATEEETYLRGSGLYNVYAVRNQAAEPDRRAEALRRTADDFAVAVERFLRTAKGALLVACCPVGPQRGLDSEALGVIAAAEASLQERLAGLGGARVLTARELGDQFPDTRWHDADADRLGHVPYSPEGFAAIGSSLVRAWSGLRRSPLKAIAVDCDQTLWRGVCGEDGALGVEVTPGHRALQELLLRQREAGVLLCLCSKNHPQDVWEVFERNPGMRLRREHLTAAWIEWKPKSEGIAALARQCNLGADSFAFIDDNPVEAAEVRAGCPAAAVLELPASPDAIEGWVRRVWAFDRTGAATAEDRRRSAMMTENARREHYRGEAGSLREFIAGLELQVRPQMVAADAEEAVRRIAQLTLRTNQFNFSTVRRSEAEVAQFIRENGSCVAFELADRFGDYGVVGAVLYRIEGEVCRIDTFLLSCRALGRGVEHRMLAETAARAAATGARRIELGFRPSGRNRPAWDFAATLGAGRSGDAPSEAVVRGDVAQLATLRYDPEGWSAAPRLPRGESRGCALTPSAGDAEAHPSAPLGTSRGAALHLPWDKIASELGTARDICAAMEKAGGTTAAEADGQQQAPDTLAGRVLRIWRRVLASPRLGLDDNFLEAGGTSLKAVQVAAALRRELGLPVSVVALFETPTARRLSARWEQPEAEAQGGADARERGARRKRRLGKREPAS